MTINWPVLAIAAVSANHNQKPIFKVSLTCDDMSVVRDASVPRDGSDASSQNTNNKGNAKGAADLSKGWQMESRGNSRTPQRHFMLREQKASKTTCKQHYKETTKFYSYVSPNFQFQVVNCQGHVNFKFVLNNVIHLSLRCIV